MKNTSRHGLAILAIALGLPALAQTPAPAKPKSPPARSEAPAARPKLDAAFDAVRQKLLAGDADRAAYEELVGAIGTSYEALGQSTPNTTTVRARLVGALDDLYARAKTGKVAPEELSALRVDMLDAQMHAQLAETAGKPGEKGAEALGASLKQLADASQELDPGTGEWRGRAQSLLEALKKQPVIETADVMPVHEELAHAATLRSEAVLEKRAAAKTATSLDFVRMRNSVGDLLDMRGAKDPSARELKEKLATAVDELEQRSKAAALTKMDFEPLRKELAQLGRAAQSEKPKLPHG